MTLEDNDMVNKQQQNYYVKQKKTTETLKKNLKEKTKNKNSRSPMLGVADGHVFEVGVTNFRVSGFH